MKLIQTKVFVTIIATLMAILFTILAYRFPQDASLYLTIEVILLPAIYIIGNYYAEHILQEQNKQDWDDATEFTEELYQKYLNEYFLRKTIETKLKNGKS